MMRAWFGPCPHCQGALSYLEGAAGSSLAPECPYCHEAIPVSRATFVMRDNSRPTVQGPVAKPTS